MHKIAVVGMSGIFPGALNLVQFCRNIMEKKESVIDIPDERWILAPGEVLSSRYQPDTASSRRAGLVSGFKFDPDGFLINKDMLSELDPLHHMVLHAGKEAISQCWCNQEIKKRTGVVLAAISLPTEKSSDLAWQIIMDKRRSGNDSTPVLKSTEPSAHLTHVDALAAGMVSVPAAILARAMGLTGGSFTLDAACASSLYAIKIACEQLQSGKTDMMVAGGVSRPDSLYTQIGFTQLKALSPSGKCSPFDKNADGLVVGEGAGIVVLKRLEDAIACKDHIWGVIAGSGWSNDIEGNLVAPASEGQIRAMKAAYKNAGWSPSDVQYIECHGSATPVGDNMELNSMLSLWQDAEGVLSRPQSNDNDLALIGKHSHQGCAIGSIKSMTGHLLTAAGAAGFIKTLLALNEKVLPPSLNFYEPSLNSPLLTTGFHVQTEPEEWKPSPLKGINKSSTATGNTKKSLARRAGVSAFGFGGINAHILVEEFKKDNLSLYFPKTFSDPSDPEAKSSASEGELHSEKHYSSDGIAPPEIQSSKRSPIAIVGMEVITPSAMNLEEFQKRVLRGQTYCTSDNSLCSAEHSMFFDKKADNAENRDGLWMRELVTCAGEFHIPPNQIEDLLPQHLMMLKAAMGAITSAGISPRPDKDDLPRTDFGAAIGIEFDYGATNFNLRWRKKSSEKSSESSTDLVEGIEGNDPSIVDKGISPPLTAERTLGALGGIVASRIAREFKLGGPCFTLSAQAASGMKALDIAIESLQREETSAFLCGCVDMAGDIRQNSLNRTLRDYASSYDECKPFDTESKGIFPSEGACAVVLKKLEQAQKDGDRIYAVIKGTGTGSGAQMPYEKCADADIKQQNYTNSLSNALTDAGITISDIGLYQAHGSGDLIEDSIELNAISQVAMDEQKLKPLSCAIGSTSATIGDTRSVSGLLSVIQASLALYHKIVPSLTKFTAPVVSSRGQSPVHFPKFAAFWIKENFREKRRACAASITTDGNASHVVLEEFAKPSNYPAQKQLELPLGTAPGSAIALKKYFRHNLRYDSENTSLSGSIGKIGESGKTAFLYPGSGNHFPGMGRGLGAMFPDILQAMDEKGASLNKRMLPDLYYPRRVSWENGWQDDALSRINSHAHNMIFGQVSFGTLMTRIAEKFKLKPDACIGHSLGETAGLFALRAWSDPEEMLTRMESSDLFTSKLAGDCTAAAKIWQLEKGKTPKWRVAAVNRSREFVENIITPATARSKYNRLYLLIINTPDECVIGGEKEQLEQFVKETGCGAMYLDGVVTVHCPVAEMCRDEYLELHRFSCHPPDNIDFYSCYLGIKYRPETEATALSILNQAIYGFDYTRLINNAWNDGVRVFIEMGPGSSCTRAVGKILGEKPHLALSLSSKDEDEETALVKALCTLAENGVNVDMTPLVSGHSTGATKGKNLPDPKNSIKIPVHRLNSYRPVNLLNFSLSATSAPESDSEKIPFSTTEEIDDTGKSIIQNIEKTLPTQKNMHMPDSYITIPPNANINASIPVDDFYESAKITVDAHLKFLEFSHQNMLEMEKQFSCLTQIASSFANMAPISENQTSNRADETEPAPVNPAELKEDMHERVMNNLTLLQDTSPLTNSPAPMFNRDMCLEFAVGSAGNVLGEPFKIIDTCPVRVRLPDEPLMLVDRIIDIEGEMLSLKSGRIITQHDVKNGAWYLDGGKAPVSISIEAGQADLFLCSWLGIDHAVMGKRRYRLLDAKVTFHRTLPEPGETIEYNIEIDRFLKQGDIYLFFFHYKGFINSELLISMRDGCAGFFTPEEVKNSGGIILKKEDVKKLTEDEKRVYMEKNRIRESKKITPFSRLVPVYREYYTDNMVEFLREGDLGGCFGKVFDGILLGKNLRLPGNRMHLIDRVLDIDPEGGRFGIGFISAEADIHPDDWFLTCHFVDDMVMPGTLMYECCAHALRIFTQRMGWISTRDDLCYDVIAGVESDLKCRGPVTTKTQKARYEIEIKSMGYSPEPYVIADAHMFSDDHRIVLYKDMGMKIAGLSQKEIERFWSKR